MSRLLEEFNIKPTKKYYETNDYSVFEDKELLDSFRLKILEDISDKGLASNYISKDVIDSEIDEITYGYSLTNSQRMYLYNLIDGEVNGYGPITELLNEDNITEIMVNSPSEIYIEIDGILRQDKSISFINNDHIIRTIERIIEPSGKSIDVNNPMVDARLANGSRINAVIPPLSKNPLITIRKFQKNLDDIDTLIGNGSLTPYMARFLEACIKAKLNIIISGSASSGKTTLLNILSNFIPEDERIITIEDVMELNLKQKHVVSLETKNANYDGIGEVTVRDLVRNSLRMRPDRIIIGEVRGAEAFDLLQAMNTGHEGSLTTLHANGCKDALNRLETMILMDGLQLPMYAIREYINSAVDLVIQFTRLRDGRRKITEISEIVGVKDNELIINPIFEFHSDHQNENGTIEGEFILNERIPEILTKIKNAGINDLDDMFKFKKKK